jgi:hypothetical protein
MATVASSETIFLILVVLFAPSAPTQTRPLKVRAPHLPGIDKCLTYRHSDDSKEPNHGISESREARRDYRAG